MKKWLWLTGVVMAGLLLNWNPFSAEDSAPQGKLAPNLWQEWKWSFPDASWNPEEADAAERQARLHASQSQDRVIEGTWTQHGPLKVPLERQILKMIIWEFMMTCWMILITQDLQKEEVPDLSSDRWNQNASAGM